MAKVTPVSWTPFIQERMITTNNIFSQGFVEQDMSSIITQGGKYFVRPYQDNLDTIDNPQKIIATTTLTPTTLSDYQENLVVCHVGDGYYETEYDRITRGDAGLDKAMLDRAGVVIKMLQNYMVNTITGVFGSALATTNYIDVTAVGSGVWSPFAATYAAQSLFGENMDMFDSYIMSSQTLSEILIAGTGSYDMASNFSNSLMQTGRVPTFLGKRVFVNDTLCAVDGDGNYPVFMMAGQPLYLAWQRNVRTYEDFDPAVGGGTYKTFWYADFVPAVKGVSWTHTSYDPTTADLATAGYWTKVFETKDIGIIKVLVKPTPLV